MELTNAQWDILEPLMIEPNPREDGKGRPRSDARTILNGILWILRTGAQWKDLPDRYPSYQTCHRRFQEWNRNGTMRNIIRSLANDLRERGEIETEESFIDGTFVPAKKGAQKSGKPKRGKGTKIMAIGDSHGLPIAFCTENASPHEVTLVERTLENLFIEENPKRMIGDKAYDSDNLDESISRNYGTKVIAPHRKNRRQPTQDGRELRRYKRRWKIERLFAWLQNFRRLVVRYEYYDFNFDGFIALGCALILLRYF
ncbi:IS5 family transposase (plasmid) [Leptospira weilii]|nr:IS5 family transposase [Leptospira weilii]ULH26781.1 IS5 family transposase [Leptospira weilii]ULH27073.1 IS5 family transposase [Leptospira weilii]ULH30749.1 IS5 family transposase [Leptospira weilii]UPY80968.1 IS5 family transposase [Leptospira weilii]